MGRGDVVGGGGRQLSQGARVREANKTRGGGRVGTGPRSRSPETFT